VRLGTPTSAYLDANVVIQFIEGDNQKLLFLIENAASELMRLYTSELTLSEVLVGPLKSGNIRLARIYDEFLTSDEILEVVPIDRAILRHSAEIRARLGNKTPDAIHVATALKCECTVLVSSDERMRVPASLKRIDITQVDNPDAWP
jgi:predicted nucleic acid-binding protein